MKVRVLSYDQRPSPLIDGMIYGLDDRLYHGHMITGDECGTNFLTFVLRLRENPGKKLNQEIDPSGDRTLAHR